MGNEGASRALKRTFSWVGLTFCIAFCSSVSAWGQAYERYKPLDVPSVPRAPVDIPTPERPAEGSQDDRVLVGALEAVVIVDDDEKIATDDSIDSLTGIHYDFVASDSLVYRSEIRNLIEAQIGQPITLRRINQLSRDIIDVYRKRKLPIVDVLIPEQRITTGTLHLVVIESRVGRIRVESGDHFRCEETARWIRCTRRGDRIYEPYLENDLFWLNQSPFRRVSVDFEKGSCEGTTDIRFLVDDICPLRGYTGIDDSGVSTLNYGRFFAGFQYGNLLGTGATLGYQYTADEEFRLLQAHSLSVSQPISRNYTFNLFGSWAGVVPELAGGLGQNGESWQVGSTLIRHFVRRPDHFRNGTFGWDFKSTNNNLEFDGTTISDSAADLFQLRMGFDDLVRTDLDQFRFFSLEGFVGPGGTSGSHTTTAFNTIRPGTSPHYVYGRLRYDMQKIIADDWMLATRFLGQVASERLLFSETLGLGGFDSIRGTDQRAFNADHGWIANFELGPRTFRWGTPESPKVLRAYGFVDVGNGYIADPFAGEDAYTFALSTGVGARYQLSDRLIARFDYGFGIEDVDAADRNDRAHFGLTWIPGPRL
ncbi:Heme/hemopexin transporter protein HuxB precursor [Neorhodopirellula pilleata]|uniref:Heme/hemopexin transporter protein HuxB n=1 Tax=Neorhodopirellula pilleata TaxID=2714738 RepID=A0A5C6AH81_9BACT|nr:Heme/hemopexin transporter protein HuxB precursor [Neorhodopirellula pilleata]